MKLEQLRERQYSQKREILKMLQEAGEEGVTNHKLRRVALRFTSVIYLLRKDGYIIDLIWSDGTYKYVLKGKEEPQNEENALDILVNAIEAEGGIVTAERLQQLMKEHNLIFKRKSRKVGA